MSEQTYTVGQSVIVKPLGGLSGTITRIATGAKVRRWPYIVSVNGVERAYSAEEIAPVPAGVKPAGVKPPSGTPFP